MGRTARERRAVDRRRPARKAAADEIVDIEAADDEAMVTMRVVSDGNRCAMRATRVSADAKVEPVAAETRRGLSVECERGDRA